MRDVIEDTVHRLLAEAVTPALLSRSWHGEWDRPLWDMLDQHGLARALCSVERRGAEATWADVSPLFVACGYHQLPLPLPEVILANRILEEAGLDEPPGLVGIADVWWEHPGLATANRPAATVVVPWGRRCSHAIAPLIGTEDGIGLYRIDPFEVVQGVNLAREPRDAVPLSVEHCRDLRLSYPWAAVRLWGAMIRAAQMAGAAQSAMEQTIRYAGERIQFGRPLAKLQAVQQQIAAAMSEVAALVAVAEQACSADPAERETVVAVAKITASEASDKVTEVAHAVHGAIGFTIEHRLHFATQRLRSWSGEFGNGRWWAERLGRAVSRSGAERLIPSLVSCDWQVLH